MSRSQREKEEWEERRWYLTRSLFEDLKPVPAIYEAADHEVHSDSSESLPDLTVQVVPKRTCDDEPEESYQELENIIKKQLQRDADIKNGRFLSDTEVAMTCDLEETGSNKDTNSQEYSKDSILETMRCPGITSSHHTEMVTIIHHSLDSPQTPLAYPKISTPTQLPHSSASTNSSPKRPVTPSPSTYSSSKSPTSSTKSRRISTRSSRHASHKYPSTFSPNTHSSPKTLPSSTELPSKRQSLVASPSRRSSRKRQSLIPSPLTHSAPKRQTRSVLASENSPSQPRCNSDAMRENVTLQHSPKTPQFSDPSNVDKSPQTGISNNHSRAVQISIYINQLDTTIQINLCNNQINKAIQTSICNNQINKAIQTSICNNQINKAVQTSICNNQINRAVQTSPIGDDSPYNFWRNIFVGEPVIYDIVPHRNLV